MARLLPYLTTNNTMGVLSGTGTAYQVLLCENYHYCIRCCILVIMENHWTRTIKFEDSVEIIGSHEPKDRQNNN
jgi:hypothetical protein